MRFHLSSSNKIYSTTNKSIVKYILKVKPVIVSTLKKKKKKKKDQEKSLENSQPRSSTRYQLTLKLSFGKAPFRVSVARGCVGRNNFSPPAVSNFSPAAAKFDEVRNAGRKTATVAIPGGVPRVVVVVASCRLSARLKIWNFYNFNFSGWPAPAWPSSAPRRNLARSRQLLFGKRAFELVSSADGEPTGSSTLPLIPSLLLPYVFRPVSALPGISHRSPLRNLTSVSPELRAYRCKNWFELTSLSPREFIARCVRGACDFVTDKV